MSTTKFRDAHILWVKNHKDFAEQINNHTETLYDYIDVLRMLYFGDGRERAQWHHIEMERLAEKQLRDDMTRFQQAQQALISINNPMVEKPDIFLTIGFNHQTWDVPKCKDVILKVLSLPFVKSASAVFELHRENGLHPHCHFYIETHNKIPKSKVLEKVWAVAGIKKVVLGKNFIDYKIAQPVHLGYIKGNKQDKKLPYVEQDKKWREENNIPHLYSV